MQDAVCSLPSELLQSITDCGTVRNNLEIVSVVLFVTIIIIAVWHKLLVQFADAVRKGSGLASVARAFRRNGGASPGAQSVDTVDADSPSVV